MAGNSLIGQRDVYEALGSHPADAEELEAKTALLDALAAHTARQDQRMPFHQFLAMLACGLMIGIGISVAIVGSLR